jgi:L-alanine-DL-glutamate epimerase-like enolase superfamily enzyme
VLLTTLYIHFSIKKYQPYVFKAAKCSCLTPALRMIKEARTLGLKVMMGSMNESVIGSAAIAQFLPQLDFVDMDGPLLMTELNGRGLDFSFKQQNGCIISTEKNK